MSPRAAPSLYFSIFLSLFHAPAPPPGAGVSGFNPFGGGRQVLGSAGRQPGPGRSALQRSAGAAALSGLARVRAQMETVSSRVMAVTAMSA